MRIPTEPIGSIPRPTKLIMAIEKAGDFADPSLDPLYDEAIRDTIERFEATGSRLSPMASSASIIISGRIASMGCLTLRQMDSGFHFRPGTFDECRG